MKIFFLKEVISRVFLNLCRRFRFSVKKSLKYEGSLIILLCLISGNGLQIFYLGVG